MTEEFNQREAEFLKKLKVLLAEYRLDIISLVHIVDSKETQKEDKPSIAIENN